MGWEDARQVCEVYVARSYLRKQKQIALQRPFMEVLVLVKQALDRDRRKEATIASAVQGTWGRESHPWVPAAGLGWTGQATRRFFRSLCDLQTQVTSPCLSDLSSWGRLRLGPDSGQAIGCAMHSSTGTQQACVHDTPRAQGAL